MKGYIYAGKVGAEKLRELTQGLPNAVTLSWDLARLDFSGELRDVGCVFNARAEIRWQRVGSDYLVLVLSDEERRNLGLEEVQGEWEVDEASYKQDGMRLIDLNDRRFYPQFEEYPVVQATRARLKGKVFLRDHMPIFVSPREVLKDETSAS